MAKFGEPVDIDKARKRMRNRVYRVGIELEGGWSKLPAGCRLAHDGSVHMSEAQLLDGCRYHGECPSPILEVETPDGSHPWMSWMKSYYPHFVNDSCGMHVHMSFLTALTYQRLMNERFPATIVAYMGKWAKDHKLSKDHPIWERLSGNSRFCQHVFYADLQAKTTQKDHDQNREGHRYTVMNYCWASKNTMECRLLPMMDTVEQGIAAVQEVIDITNGYLVATSARELKHKAEILDDGDVHKEEIRVRV